jgi:DNA polymerase II small subunit
MKEVLKKLLLKGILVKPEVLDLFGKIGKIDQQILEKIIDLYVSKTSKKIIKIEDLERNINEILIILQNVYSGSESKLNNVLSIKSLFKLSRKEVIEQKADVPLKQESQNKSNLSVLSSYNIQGKKIEFKDFVTHFRNRYIFIKNIMQENKNLQNLVSIDKISHERKTTSIIGMILKKRVTKNKNIILDVEDLTGSIKLLISNTKTELFEKAKELIEDDIIGFSCSGNREILFVNDFFFPDIFATQKTFSDKEQYLAVISDMHVGSTMFLEENFLKFIDWINGKRGNSSQKNMAKQVKYLFIVGDNIDGVGIYPGQEGLLEIKELENQYNKLYELLSKIRNDVEIVICPGQHDSVRVAEPQPPLNQEHASKLYSLKNITFVSNPALIELRDGDSKKMFDSFKVLMYHGASLHGFVDNIEELRINRAHDTPARIVKHLLKRRHLAPMHSEVVYIPFEKEDPQLIKEIPDLIVTGEVHRIDVDDYNGIKIICSSCWQSVTPFEEKVGNHPDPCKVPLLNLKTKKVQIIDFN